MNRSFKSIWSEAQGAWVAVSEVAAGRGKKSRAGASAGIVALSITMALLTAPAVAQTLIDNSGVSFGGNASAAVEIGQAGGLTQGFLTARVALTAANIFGLTGNTMTAGMQVYNTATTTGSNGVSPGLYTWNGSQWISNSEVPYVHSNSTVVGNSTSSNSGATGANSTALGPNALAAGINSFAAGFGANASGTQTMALGINANAGGVNSIAFGNRSSTAGFTQIAIGSGAKTDVLSTEATVMGNGATATNAAFSTVVGSGAVSTGNTNSVFGYQASATNVTNATAIGEGALVTGSAGIALGSGAAAIGNLTTAVGVGAISSGNTGMALGLNAVNTVDNLVALGANAFDSATASATTAGTTTYNSSVIGGKTLNYAGGTPIGVVSVGGPGVERRIQNVAAGQIDSTSTDAVNGSQLYAVADALTSTVAAGSTHYYSVNDNGVQGGNYANDGATGVNALAAGVGAVANGSSAVAVGNAALAQTTNSIAIGKGANILDPRSVDSIAIGTKATIDDYLSVALGNGAKTGDRITSGPDAGAMPGGMSVAIGNNAYSRNQSSVAIGSNALASDGQDGINIDHIRNTAIGADSVASGGSATAVGSYAGAAGIAATSIGYDASASGNSSAAVGVGSRALVNDSVALGSAAAAYVAGSVALGSQSVATTGPGAIGYAVPGASATQIAAINATTSSLGAVSVGDASNGLFRQITGVAAGTTDSDAVNVSQLRAVSSAVSAIDFPIRSGNAGPYTTSATGTDSLAVGATASTSGDQNTVVGEHAVASGPGNSVSRSTVVGAGSQAIAADQIVVGAGSATQMQGRSVIIGNTSYATDGTDLNISTSLGLNNSGSLVVGNNSFSTGISVGIGNDVDAEDRSVAVGSNTVAMAQGVALGFRASATAPGGVALGANSVSDRALAPTAGSLVAGSFAVPFNTTDKTLLGAVSVGNATSYRQITNVADGTQSQDAVTVRQLTGALQSFAVTPTKYFHANSAAADSLAVGSESVAVGPQTVVNGNNAIGIGNGATVQISAPGSIAIGQGANTQLADSIAVGTNASAAAVQGIALGAGSIVNVAGGVALGAGSVASTAAGAKGYVPTGASTAQTAAVNATTSTLAGVSVGDAATGQLRQINGVAAGAVDSDAVNVSQLKAVQTSVTNIDNNAVKYDTTAAGTTNYNSVNLGNSNSTGPVTLGNVANGVAPNDAVNVQQLNAGVTSANAYTDARVNGLQGNIDGVARKAYAGVASAMALESAPYIAGKTTYAAGVGYYQSQGAVGVALRRTADNGRWSVTGGVSASAGGVAVRAGVSGIWD